MFIHQLNDRLNKDTDSMTRWNITLTLPDDTGHSPPPQSEKIFVKVKYLLKGDNKTKQSLTTLWHTHCTTMFPHQGRCGSSDTRGDCTFCTGWRKQPVDSEAPDICRSSADCISRCHALPLSSSHPATLFSASWNRTAFENQLVFGSCFLIFVSLIADSLCWLIR